MRAYPLKDVQGEPKHAYVVVWRQNVEGGYYDFEGTDWLSPPLFKNAREPRRSARRTYKLVDDGSHIHVIGWRSGNVLYWVTNTLLEELSNVQMLAIAKSAQPLRYGRPPAQGVVERLVDERIRVRVLGARDGADRPALEAREAPPSRRGGAASSPRV